MAPLANCSHFDFVFPLAAVCAVDPTVNHLQNDCPNHVVLVDIFVFVVGCIPDTPHFVAHELIDFATRSVSLPLIHFVQFCGSLAHCLSSFHHSFTHPHCCSGGVRVGFVPDCCAGWWPP